MVNQFEKENKKLAYFIANEIELKLYEGIINPFDQKDPEYKEVQDFYLRLALKINKIKRGK